MTKVVNKVSDLQELITNKKVGAVFTMGALHAGHGELIDECRRHIGGDSILIVTIFVNPTQFNDPKDLEQYPRDLANDVELCAQHNVDIVFAPIASEVYPPDNPVKEISPGEIAEILEGQSRPGHFEGVATVVNRLLEITQPAVTCFGEKDYQQLVVVRQLVKAQAINVEVVAVNTVRETDGLAMSSRNQRLTFEQRTIAANLFKALKSVSKDLAAGNSIDVSVSRAKDWLAQFPLVDLDYLTVLSRDLAKPVPGLARILIAARIGDVRLIDNLECELVAANV